MLASTAQMIPKAGPAKEAKPAGFRFEGGTHTSRTIMFSEISAALSIVPASAKRDSYTTQIVSDNCLGKATASTRRLTNQRLGEIYGLDPQILLFRVFRKLWDLDEKARPLLSILIAIARDPFLMGSVSVILSLPAGKDLPRHAIRDALRDAVGDRLNESILDKVARNIASSWTQSGHLEGRTFKVRRKIEATAVSAAYAVFLAYLVGFRGEDVLRSGWMQLLDCDLSGARELAFSAKRVGLLDLQASGAVLDFSFDSLDPWKEGAKPWLVSTTSPKSSANI